MGRKIIPKAHPRIMVRPDQTAEFTNELVERNLEDLRSLKPDQPDKAFGFDPKCPTCPAPAIEPVTTQPEQTSVGTYFMAGAGIGVILIICWAFYKLFRANRESWRYPTWQRGTTPSGWDNRIHITLSNRGRKQPRFGRTPTPSVRLPVITIRDSTPSASPRVYCQLPEKELSPAVRGLTPRRGRGRPKIRV